jgi:hypothetical protein
MAQARVRLGLPTTGSNDSIDQNRRYGQASVYWRMKPRPIAIA